MKRNGLLIAAILSLASQAYADSLEGYFIGLGAGYNSINVNAQLSGTLDVISGFPPLGHFSGQKNSANYTQSAIAPVLQMGYLDHFNCYETIWGMKLLYQFLNAKKNENVFIDYQDPFTTADQVSATMQTTVNHELAALALLGWNYGKGIVHIGLGPSLFGVENKIKNSSDTLSGYYVGNFNQFSSHTNWVWGGMAEVGASYYYNPAWFVDLNYSYAISKRYSANNVGWFYSQVNGGLNSGNISFDASKRITAQSLTVTVNKTFC